MTHASYPEHAEDILGQWLEGRSLGHAALVMVTKTEGGAVREMGALMAVSHKGDVAGYVSGGCIDADVVLHAAKCLETGAAATLRYGVGSPFKDLPLPCGGAIEVTIFPHLDRKTVQTCWADLVGRRRAQLVLEGPSGRVSASYRPKLRIRIAGRGADAIALAKLGQASGIATRLALRDSDDVRIAQSLGLPELTALQTPSSLPRMDDDAWTAFVLMFHDGDWELPLLQQALSGPAYYVGAVGSRRTHAKRCELLSEAGVHPDQVSRIRGPVGLIPSMRDASMLAVSALAEIVEAYHRADTSPFATTALVILAAGASSRFEDGDKLLADLDGQPVVSHAASVLSGQPVARRIAIVGPGQSERGRELAQVGWSLVENTDASEGQGTSVSAAIDHLQSVAGVENALILLGDMPSVPDQHLLNLRAALAPGVPAVLSRAGDVVGPPVLIAREVFPKLQGLTGDRGARGLLEGLPGARIVDFEADHHGLDIDRRSDLTAIRSKP